MKPGLTIKNPKLEPVSAFSIYRKTQHQNTRTISKKRKNRNTQPPKIPVELTKLPKLEKVVPTISDNQLGKPKKLKKKSKRPATNGAMNENIPKLIKAKTNSNNLPKQHKTNAKKDDPVSNARKLFKWLISPLTEQEFFDKFWEIKPVHIKRNSEKYYTHILDSDGLDKIFRNNSLFYTRNVDVVSYQNGVKEVHNSEGKAAPSALWDYYSNGCSLRVLNPQSYSNKIHLLISTLQEYFGCMVGTNIYLTPPGSQGFAPHYDDIEAFVVQLEGRKHWKLYQPQGSDVLARYSSPNIKREDLGDPIMTLTLEAGEVLYFPRGTIHEGCTSEDSHSLHITVSMYQQTSYVDLLEHILPKALKKAAESDVKFRKGLPINYLKRFGTGRTDASGRASVVEYVCDLMQSLIEHVDVDNAADQLGKKFMRDSMPPVLSQEEMQRSVKLDGPYLSYGRIENRIEIDPDTQIRLVRYYCIRLVCDADASPRLYYNTENANVYHGEEEQWLELETPMVPAIETLQKIYPGYIAVEELPMEDITLKMQLVSDLWEHGILVTQDTLLPIDD